MISAEELCKKIKSSDELKAEIDTIRSDEALAEFLKKNDCDAATDEFRKCFKTENVELDDAELDNVSGGSVPDKFHYVGGNSGNIAFASCANCGGRMEYSYKTTGFLKENHHYVCKDCGRDIWFDTIFRTSGVTFEGRR